MSAVGDKFSMWRIGGINLKVDLSHNYLIALGMDRNARMLTSNCRMRRPMLGKIGTHGLRRTYIHRYLFFPRRREREREEEEEERDRKRPLERDIRTPQGAYFSL